MSDSARLWLVILLTLWLFIAGYSVMQLVGLPPETRETVFLGWQGIAGILAVLIWGLSRKWPRKSGVRGIGNLPILLSLLVAGGVIARHYFLPGT